MALSGFSYKISLATSVRIYTRNRIISSGLHIADKQLPWPCINKAGAVSYTQHTYKNSKRISTLNPFSQCTVNFYSGNLVPVIRSSGIKLKRISSCSLEPLGVRFFSSDGADKHSYYRRTNLIYVCAAGVFMLGMSYAGVPLYRMFCQATGLGGTVSRGHDTSKIETMQSVPERIIRVRFNADVSSSMRWNFKPQQTEVKVVPGETALAFYTATNPTDKPIIGISTYNVVPFEAGQYFNKIQCFCFEEQRLNPHEQVDMPVFFYIDPQFAEDPKLRGVETITLSYTFFEAKDGVQLPLPGFMTQPGPTAQSQ